MVITRGDLFWADLGAPVGSRPAKLRPVLTISADLYNDTSLNTVVVAAVTSDTRLAAMPGQHVPPGRQHRAAP